MEMKYVMVKYMDIETPIVFPKWMNHADIVVKSAKCVSADFVDVDEDACITYGKSTSLKLGSKPEDAAFIEKMIFGRRKD